MRYMVVDDSKIARKMMIKVLKETAGDGIFILEAQNGQEAVEKYVTGKIDYVFMDLTMPVMDGFEATKQIISNDPNANIIVVSADIQVHAVNKAQESGASNFIKKPIDSKKLQKVFQKANYESNNT